MSAARELGILKCFRLLTITAHATEAAQRAQEWSSAKCALGGILLLSTPTRCGTTP